MTAVKGRFMHLSNGEAVRLPEYKDSHYQELVESLLTDILPAGYSMFEQPRIDFIDNEVHPAYEAVELNPYAKGWAETEAQLCILKGDDKNE